MEASLLRPFKLGLRSRRKAYKWRSFTLTSANTLCLYALVITRTLCMKGNIPRSPQMYTLETSSHSKCLDSSSGEISTVHTRKSKDDHGAANCSNIKCLIYKHDR